MRVERLRPAAPPAYQAIASLIAARFGLALSSYSATTVRLLLGALPPSLGEHGAEALGRVVAACSIGETMFMRHPEQFAALRELAATLPAARTGAPLVVWSAGCATGEEAYSLAAVLAPLCLDGVRVIGTDLNPASIERARTGHYRLWSMRGVDASQVEDWLRIDALDVAVRSHLRPLVEFRTQNLVEPDYPEDVDVIFCRNVLLYFHEEAAAAVLGRFARSLRPGGLLFLGYFDPTPGPGGVWSDEQVGSVRVLRRMGQPREAGMGPAAGAGSHAARVPAASPLPDVAAARAPAAFPPSPEEARRRQLEEGLAVARSLSGQRAFGEALRLLDRLSEMHPLELEPYVLLVMIAEEAGLAEVALAAARRTWLLAPNEPMCHYLLASCLDGVGETRRAAVHLSLARSTLARHPDPTEPVPYGEGLTALQLRRMIDARSAGAR